MPRQALETLVTILAWVGIGAVLMLAAYGAVWAGVRWFTSKGVAAARMARAGERAATGSGRGFARHSHHDEQANTL